eukprot:TRINITY_DN31572_c0_g1_i3.p1 TRINITY_DN31572_c0_g1~~TRINITY_DN31572_c0_g1_i3.p1  ORF type:complete len:192 (-),score=20.34 TRINITY_DN31572_c0_g1_i3:667-1242(-)
MAAAQRHPCLLSKCFVIAAVAFGLSCNTPSELFVRIFRGDVQVRSLPLSLQGRSRKSRIPRTVQVVSRDNRVAYIAVVDAKVNPGDEDGFIQASKANARESVNEATNQRFDVLQSAEDSTSFRLVEIYRNGQGPPAHKETAHYNAWREKVADMMAVPRSATQYETIFPFKATSYASQSLIRERGDEPGYYR